MARRYGTRVLSFPVPDDAQLSALPAPQESRSEALRRINREMADPEIAVLRMQHEIERMKRLGSLMSWTDVSLIQGYVFILADALDQIEVQLKHDAEIAAQKTGLIA